MQVSFRTAIAVAAMLVAGTQASVAGVYRSSPRPGKSTGGQSAFRRRRSSKPYRTDVNGCGQREQLRAYRRAQGGPGIELWNGNWISR